MALNQPPADENGQQQPPAERPTPPRPAPQPGATPPRPAPAAGGPAPARPTPAAGAPGAPRPAAGAVSPEQKQAIAAAARREPAGGGRAQAEQLVYVWPHLLIIELISALLMLFSLLVMSLLVNAPLEGHANINRTPNPSKAPWYFLNLQELLLHMHPALAGVLVPAGALALIALIPYIDRDTRDVGKWFGTPRAKPIFWFTAVYTTIVLVLLILFDEFIGLKPTLNALANATGLELFRNLFVADVLIPTAIMNFPILVLLIAITRLYGPLTIRDYMIALFTGFVISYLVLTIVGTFFRGQGMHLYWPWAPEQVRIE